MYIPKQRDIVTITFDPSRGTEIKKRRPAVVLSSNQYNRSTRMIIVCPLTTSEKQRPYFIPVKAPNLLTQNEKTSKVNTSQVYSFDYSEKGGRKIKFIDRLDEHTFHIVSQHFLVNFDFPSFF